jgi:hypothetical protein
MMMFRFWMFRFFLKLKLQHNNRTSNAAGDFVANYPLFMLILES